MKLLDKKGNHIGNIEPHKTELYKYEVEILDPKSFYGEYSTTADRGRENKLYIQTTTEDTRGTNTHEYEFVKNESGDYVQGDLSLRIQGR